MSYTDIIANWAGVPADITARYAREADALAARAPGMHDTRVEIIVRAAFDGSGDVTGDDDYGVSVAWLDLADIGDYGDIVRQFAADMPDTVTADDYGMSLAAYLATHEHVTGHRYVLAYWDADGCRSVLGFPTRAAMMETFHAIEADYLEWCES